MKNNTESIEDYLTAIYRMQERGEVRSKQISHYLKVRKSSVSEMLSRLAKQKLVEHGKYEGVKLTRKGEDIARTTVFKHRVIELFLVKMLKRGKNEVHGEAHRLEHAFSEKSVKEIYKLVGKPRTGVHGEEIPAI